MSDEHRPAAAKPAASKSAPKVKADPKPLAAPRAPIPSAGKGIEITGAVIGAALFVPALAIRGAKRATRWVKGQWER